jgi:hypothetical protein
MRGHAALTGGWEMPVQAGPPPERKPRKPRKDRPKVYRMRKPRNRKIPQEVRQQIYQLALTSMETEREIRRLFDQYGFKKQGRNMQRQRIMDERGE